MVKITKGEQKMIKRVKKPYMAINVCKKCNHKWVNRKPRKPKMCPKCKSVNWEKK